MEQHKQYNLPESDQNAPLTKQGVSDTSWQEAPNVVRTDKSLIVKNFFRTDDIETYTGKGQKFNRTAISTLVTGAVFTVATTDYLIGVTNLSYAPTIGLPKPSLVGQGKTFIIKDEAGGAATTTITVRSAGEENLDGASTSTITTNYGAKSYFSDGSNWFTY